MNRRLLQPILLLATATVLAACAGTYGAGDEGETVVVDLLVVPPSDSGLPPQVKRNVDWSDVQDGTYDIDLTEGASFLGHVLDTAGQPIANAAVRITMRGPGLDKVVFSTEAGAATAKLGSGTYDVEVTPDRGTHPTLPPRIFREVVIPESGADVAMNLVMAPGHKIRGQLLGPSGMNLEGYRISARSAAADDPSTYADSTIAGFEIYVSSTGNWIVQVTPPNGSSNPVARKTVAVDGEENVPIQYPPFQTYQLTGAVTPAGGGPVPAGFAGIPVRARAQIPSADPDATYYFDQKTYADAAGLFSLDVVPGTYTVSIEPGIDLAYSHRVIEGVEVTNTVNIAPTLTQLYPVVDVGGQVLSESGDGTADARVRLVAADGSAYQFSGRTDGAGRYLLPMDIGEYAVTVLPAPGSGLVRQSASAAIDGETHDLDFVLAPGHVVRGRVRSQSGDPVADATVTALQAGGTQAVGSGESVTNADGGWTLTVPVVSAFR